MEAELLNTVVVAFLDRYLRGEGDAFDALPELVAEHDSATFEVKPDS